MKKKTIKITKNDQVLYNGKLIDLPLKDEYIIKKSIELFDDDDPCIIHKSYVMKGYADSLLELFKKEGTTQLNGVDYIKEFSPIDLMETDQLVFIIEG